MGIKDKRIQWIDCAKAIAIIAVLVDHSYNMLYFNDVLQKASFFSVSTFVILSGVATGLTAKFKDRNYTYQLKKVGKLFGDYAIATGLYLIFAERFFDIKTYFTYLINFNIKGLFYFLLFFFQLLLISPFLVNCCKFISKSDHVILQVIFIMFIFVVSILCIKFTQVLPVYGGGKYLFGGTYLFLYYLGLVLGWYHVFDLNKKNKCIMFLLLGIFWFVWLYLDEHSLFLLDDVLKQFLGNGINPPGIQLIIFSLITVFLLYIVFSLLEEGQSKVGGIIVKFFSFLGKFTLYIYMYHLLIRDFIFEKLVGITDNIWLLRIFVFIPMIIVPVFGVCLIRFTKKVMLIERKSKTGITAL